MVLWKEFLQAKKKMDPSFVVDAEAIPGDLLHSIELVLDKNNHLTEMNRLQGENNIGRQKVFLLCDIEQEHQFTEIIRLLGENYVVCAICCSISRQREKNNIGRHFKYDCKYSTAPCLMPLGKVWCTMLWYSTMCCLMFLGMVAWKMTMKTPECPTGRSIVVIANDITFKIGSFGPQEDKLFQEASGKLTPSI